MKQIYLLLATLFLVHVQVFGQSVPSYVPTNGLVGWWGFNGNAQDGSGNGNHGTVNGATLTTDRFGNQNGAYYFDGVNDYIQLPFGLQNQPISVSVWFKTNIIGSQSIVDNDIAHLWGNNIILDYQANNRICLLFHDGHVVSNYAYSTNQNYHVIAIWENTSCKLYVNGVLIDNFLHSQGVNEGGLYRFGVGSSNAFWFNGTLDDIGIWNRALTPQEITNLYIAQSCQVSITTQPSNQTTGTNRNVQFSVVSSDSNSTYRWQSNSGFGFQDLHNAGQYSGVTSSTLTVSNTSLQNNNQLFRCIVTTPNCGSDTSDIVTLTVSSSGQGPALPRKFNYQAVVRDSMGALITNRNVSLRVTLLRGSAPHSPELFKETHQANTNATGLLTVKIGNGQSILGSMDSIDWSQGMVYLRTEIDPTGGNTFSVVNTAELLSVPYALYSLNSGGGPPGPAGPQGPSGPMGLQGVQGAPGNDGVGILSITNTGNNMVITLSNGNTYSVPLPAPNDQAAKNAKTLIYTTDGF